ncbi:MAG: hypothetical protein Q8R82_19260 [Hyphomonadaceae bacterium]|nr:hypothetical protein [Hyphomonadaceae bacterium]
MAVYNSDDDFYAAADLCLRGEPSLAEEGRLRERKIFGAGGGGDVRTEGVLTLSYTDAIAYRVVQRDGEVFLHAGDRP